MLLNNFLGVDEKLKISFYTSWNIKCGIADYSARFKSALEDVGISVAIIPVGSKKGLLNIKHLGKMMNEADIAHIQHEFSFFANAFFICSFVHCAIFLRQIKIPKVLTVHEVAPLGERLSRFPFLRLYRTIFALVDLIIVHTEKHRMMILEMGVPESKVINLSHPVPEVKLPVETKKNYKKLFGVDRKNVLTVFGFPNRRKGYELVLDAIQDLDDCIFFIAGGQHPNDRTGYIEQLKNKILLMNLEHKVKILGYLQEADIPAVMGATDIVLAPFCDMPGSGSLSLGIAYHKPIIGSDIEQMQELKSRGVGIELFQKNKKGDLREKIVFLLHDIQRQSELERHTIAYAQEYSYGKTAAKFLELYSKLLRN
ncbi:MAG: glycosyltransferase [Nitrospirae bacterium]|nr:glycosyltransferase [Nitrospirota bacterium]